MRASAQHFAMNHISSSSSVVVVERRPAARSARGPTRKRSSARAALSWPTGRPADWLAASAPDTAQVWRRAIEALWGRAWAANMGPGRRAYVCVRWPGGEMIIARRLARVRPHFLRATRERTELS